MGSSLSFPPKSTSILTFWHPAKHTLLQLPKVASAIAVKMKIEIVDEDASMSTGGRITEVNEGQDVDTCYICNNAPNPEMAVKARPDVGFCCEEHRDMHQDDSGDNFPFYVQCRPEVGRCKILTLHVSLLHKLGVFLRHFSFVHFHVNVSVEKNYII